MGSSHGQPGNFPALWRVPDSHLKGCFLGLRGRVCAHRLGLADCLRTHSCPVNPQGCFFHESPPHGVEHEILCSPSLGRQIVWERIVLCQATKSHTGRELRHLVGFFPPCRQPSHHSCVRSRCGTYSQDANASRCPAQRTSPQARRDPARTGKNWGRR